MEEPHEAAMDMRRSAMELADQAFLVELSGKKDGPKRAKEIYTKAWEIELEAAREEKDNFRKSTLFRSAGWLALNAGNRERAVEIVKEYYDKAPPETRREMDKVIEAAAEESKKEIHRNSEEGG